MRIFLSHSSRNKPLIREVKRYLPEHIYNWIDEKDLLIGDDLEKTLKETIETASDFVVIFIDSFSVNSPWVKKELSWALSREEELKRVFVLPVVLERDAWEQLEPSEFQKRKYLSCLDYDENSIRTLASQLIAELFAWLSRDLESKRNPILEDNVSLRLLNDADRFVANVAEQIRLLVYSHRRSNPLAFDDLFLQLKGMRIISSLSEEQFNTLLVRLRQQGYLSGLVYTGQSIYINEEHYNWKVTLNVSAKKKIANKALTFINSGDTIALDAGSTTLELAKYLSQGIKMRVWDSLRLVTNSVSAANELLTTLTEMGASDSNQTLQVYIVGGRIRANTLASVDEDISPENHTSFGRMLEKLGGADICFVGTNGITQEDGFSTHVNSETKSKSEILKFSTRRFVLTDSSKFGIKEEISFASFDDGITIITDRNPEHVIIKEIETFIASTPSKIVFV